MKPRHFVRNGFTIVELIIVVAVIAILAALIAVGYNGIQASARDKALLSDMSIVESELTRYAVKNGGEYDTSLTWDSSSGTNANISFTPSPGNVIIVSVTGSDYCIRAYNPKSNSKTLSTAKLKASNAALCSPGWIAMSLQSSVLCGVSTQSAAAYCRGSDFYGRFGYGAATLPAAPIPINQGALAGKGIKSIAVGPNSTCAITTDGDGYCWGLNMQGGLGDGTMTNSTVPVQVVNTGVLAGKRLEKIEVGYDHTCAIANDKRLYCWGGDNYGKLGRGSWTSASSVPVASANTGPLAGKDIVSVTLGYITTCVTIAEGDVYCLGLNNTGQFGNGTTSNSSSPQLVTGALSGLDVTAMNTDKSSYSAVCAIASEELYCWSGNDSSQVGNGGTTAVLSPTKITAGPLAGKKITSVAVGDGSTCAVADGILYCWGNNQAGQLGNGTVNSSTLPTPVSTSGPLSGVTILSVSGAGKFFCALSTSYQQYCWGNGGNGPGGWMSQPSSPVLYAPVSL